MADEARWLAIGGPRYWVEHFARRAEVILVMSNANAEVDFALRTGVKAAFRGIGRLLENMGHRRRATQRAGDRRRKIGTVVDLVAAVRESATTVR